MIQSLLSHGADCNIKNNEGRDVWFYLAVRRSLDGMKGMVDMIINNGGDINGEDQNGNTPLSESIPFNSPFLIHVLHSKFISSISSSTLQKIVASNCSQAIMKLLLIKFPQLCKDELLGMMVMNTYHLEWFLNQNILKIEINSKSNVGALAKACKDGDSRVMNILLSHGAVMSFFYIHIFYYLYF